MTDLVANASNSQLPSAAAALRDRATTGAGSSSPVAGTSAGPAPLRSPEADNGAAVLAIDLLPGAYKERVVVRQSRLWQLAVVLVFGGIIACTAVFQYGLRCATRRRVAAIAGPYTDAQQHAQILGQLHESLKTDVRTAELYTFLKHPWPRTQILRAAVTPLPPSIRMEELRIGREEFVSSEMAAQEHVERAPAHLTEETERQKLPAESDLDELRSECERLVTVVQMTGLTRSNRDLHKYLADVVKSPLIREAELRSLEDVGEQGQAEISRFEARLEVIPGFGLPKGPVAPVPASPDLTESRLANKEVGG